MFVRGKNEDGAALLKRTEADYSQVVRPYLDGRDIARTVDQRPTRYVIDFAQMPLEEAARFPAALDIVRRQAKAARESSKSYSRNPQWWQFLWPRPDFRAAIAEKARFIAGTATGKRILFIWCDASWRPSNATNVIALDSDYAMGVLTSRIHTDWAQARSSTLEDRIRYTPSSAFETFPWPDAAPAQREEIGRLSRELLELRSTLCREHEIGLTKLYNQVDEGAFSALRAKHRDLDLAVVRAYGWPDELLDDPAARNVLLFERNARIHAGACTDTPF